MVVDCTPVFESTGLPLDPFWEGSGGKQEKMHNIHYYPAKFPPFIFSKALSRAREKGIKVNTVADIFCGCGTTALEAKTEGVGFWGCDINPVATLIARVKSNSYQSCRLERYFGKIVEKYHLPLTEVPEYYRENARLDYWFSKKTIVELYALLHSIESTVPQGKYRDFFICAFSNILKPTSRWLTKSIKPQVDPSKKPSDVMETYKKQVKSMCQAAQGLKFPNDASSSIETANFLEIDPKKHLADLVVTSPPYVTSYEYADIHQLSAIWLRYSEDYRALRKGSIGSVYEVNISQDEIDALNDYGRTVYSRMLKKDRKQAQSIAKYFCDIKRTTKRTYRLLKPHGLAIFVIGNTSYRGIKIDNAKFLSQCLHDAGFPDVSLSKRIIRGKILSPYRDSKGRFSSNHKHRKVYRYEYVVTAEKVE